MKTKTSMFLVSIVLLSLIISSCSNIISQEDEGVVILSPSPSQSLYYCSSDDNTRTCPGGISGGQGTRCYYYKEGGSRGWDTCSEGWVDKKPVQESTGVINNPVGNYHCYYNKGYCRRDGLLTNPKVPINTV